MEKIAKQLTELIGHTPLLELSNYEKENALDAQVVAKLEYFNPLGSVESISLRIIAPASSIKSIALSGRNLSVIYLSESLAAATIALS